jgi:uncharacterized protein (TIGR02646 family)
MRRVEHRAIAPNPMGQEEVTQARREILDFLDRSQGDQSVRRAPIDEKLYLRDGVRVALQALFHGKCAYCETQRSAVSIEHHRPISDAGGGKRPLPHHYSWLAYDWENLLLVCEACSGRKRNLFPVNSGRAPLKAPLPRVRAQESPKLLDPGYDRPNRHLDFTLDGLCHARSKRGAATIGILELNRGSLVEERRNAFAVLTRKLADRGSEPEAAANVLRELDDPSLPFAGSQQILRYRFLAALAERVDHFGFGFEDAEPLIESILGQATADDVRLAVRALERPAREEAVGPVPAAARPFSPPITRILIENFKAIDRVEINFPPKRTDIESAASLMFLGENATGKSSVLEAITLALMGTEAANKLAKARDFEPRRDRGGHPGGYGPTRVEIAFLEGPPAELRISSADKFEGTSESRAAVLAYSSRRYFKPGKRRRTRSEGQKSLFDPSWPLPHPELWLDDLGPNGFPEVARVLSDILLLPKGAFLKQDADRGVVIVNGEIETPLARHSEGYRSIFATAVDILRGLRGSSALSQSQGVVLIDEVETHLHPRWKMRVMAGLRKALPRIQFIVTTHDPLCLRGMGQGEVQVMARDAKNHIGLVPDLPDVSGMRIDQILSSEHFGMHSTLDPDFQEDFDEYYRLLRESQTNPGLAPQVERLRKQINDRQHLGQTEREQRLLVAIDRHIATRVASAPERGQQDQALEAEIDAIWNDARSKSE